LVAGTRYAVGVIQVGTAGSLIGTGTFSNISFGLTPRLVAVRTGQTDLASFTGALTLAGSMVWGRLS